MTCRLLSAVFAVLSLCPDSLPAQAGGKGGAGGEERAPAVNTAVDKRGPRGVSASIRRALRWLRSQQQDSGQFRSSGAGKLPSFASPVAVHSLGMLAFLGDGNTLRAGPHKEVVKKATLWLRSQGGGVRGRYGSGGLDQALALQAIAETAGLSQYRLLSRDVREGLAGLTRLQSKDGGFPAGPAGQASDPIASLHALLAMKAARELCKEPARAAEQRLLDWFAGLPGRDGLRLAAGYGSQRGEASATAAWLFARCIGGDPKQRDELIPAFAQRILAADKALASAPSPLDEYLRSHAAHQAGGPLRRAWETEGRRALLARQDRAGAIPAPAGGAGSRLWSTALGVLSLQASYRFSAPGPGRK